MRFILIACAVVVATPVLAQGAPMLPGVAARTTSDDMMTMTTTDRSVDDATLAQGAGTAKRGAGLELRDGRWYKGDRQATTAEIVWHKRKLQFER